LDFFASGEGGSFFRLLGAFESLSANTLLGEGGFWGGAGAGGGGACTKIGTPGWPACPGAKCQKGAWPCMCGGKATMPCGGQGMTPGWPGTPGDMGQGWNPGGSGGGGAGASLMGTPCLPGAWASM